MADGIVVVCGRDRAPALPDVARLHDVAGLVRVGRGYRPAIDIGRFDTLGEALAATGASAVAVLSPYPGLARDAEHYRERGVTVVTAGPPTADAADADYDAGRWRCLPALEMAAQLRADPTFGRTVYLRLVSGGGAGLLSAWWALLEALEAATDLLDAQLQRLWIGAVSRRSRWHVTGTVIAVGGGSAQLVVGPTAAPGDDVTLLGTGGLLQSANGADAVVLRRDDGDHLLAVPSPWPDAEWIQAVLAGRSSAGSRLGARLRGAVLTAVRRAARSGCLQPVVLGS